MKSSTFDVAVAVFFVFLGIGIWSLSASHPSETVASENGVVPSPPARLAEGTAHRVNPLRTGTVAQAPIRTVSDVQEQRYDASAPQLLPAQHVTTASFDEIPKNESTAQKTLSGFNMQADPFGTPNDNFLESAGFPEELKSVTTAPLEPQPLPAAGVGRPSPFDASVPNQSSVTIRSESVPLNKTPQSLGDADPFGASPGKAAQPIASNHAPLSAPIAPQFEQEPATQPNRRLTSGSIPMASNIDEGTGMPGPIALEGSQTPHLTLEKILPEEIVVEQPATIKTLVRNVGRSTAKEVTVRDRVPQGSRLLSTSPEATISANGELFWTLGNLDGGDQLTVEMRIVPLREGEIGSVASVGYSAEVSARKSVTRPQLQLEVKGPQEIRMGEVANMEIIISNPGTATATGIVLEEYVPDGLYHKDGKVLVNKNVDTLKPKEAKKLMLPLTCTGNGVLVNRVVVSANGNLRAEEKTTIRALSPILELEIIGAKQRFLERKSEYKLVVSNGGTASARNVDLVLTLPTAVQFVSTNQNGVYEPTTHTVHWALEELPSQESGEIELVLIPGKIGNYSMKFTGNGESNLKAEKTHPMIIDGLAALSFEVVGQSLVEAGKDTTYEVKVANKGTKAANNVKIRATMTDGMNFVRAEGPVRYQSQAGLVQFEPLAQLDSKGEKTYKITAKCLADGDHRLSVQLISDDLSAPITKEESTKVFK